MLSLLLALIVAASAAPLFPVGPIDKRAVINHDAVVGFPQTVPNSVLGQNYLRFKPYLYVVNGCVPFPAVDADGNTGGGLNPSGSQSGGCSSNTGQVYARGGTHNGRDAIMYSWYWPKDEASRGMGHRHDWESAVVWIDDLDSSAPTIEAVSASAHGGYQTHTSGLNLSGNRPLFRYFSNWPLNHQLGFTSHVGGEQPLIAWESLTEAARTAFENTDFGSGNVPFKNANFQNNLAEAAP